MKELSEFEVVELNNVELENLKKLAELYEKKYEVFLDQNRRVRAQSVLAVAVTTTSFSLLAPMIKVSAATNILFAVSALIFVTQAIATLLIYWPYKSKTFLKDDWEADWDNFVAVSKQQHLVNLASAFSNCSDAEKSEMMKRDRSYWFLLSSCICCPFLLLLAFFASRSL